MKKQLLRQALLLLTMLFSSVILPAQNWDGTVADRYAGGDGTKESPFLISNAAELAKLAHDVNSERDFSLGRYFRLTQDIMFNDGVNAVATAKLEDGTAFTATPIVGNFATETDYTAFQGVFDGDGHTIRGIYHTFAQDITNYLGLFRVAENAEIRNLGIEDSYVYAGAYLSNLVGRAINTRIINCHIAASTLKGWGSNSGPLCAQALGTTKIQNCYSLNVAIAGKNDMGAIVGRIGNGDRNEVIVENCYTNCAITLNNRENRGGVTATNAEGSIVRNCYFTADAAQNAVWPAQDKGTTVGCRQLTPDEMQGADFLALLNGNARQIPAACRWQPAVNGFPVHDYGECTPDVENQREVSMLATNPVPANGDTHADLDAQMLSWTAARDGKTVAQYLYIGTDSAAIASATSSSAVAMLGTDCDFSISSLDAPLSNLQKYYWRVDRVDADGIITTGDVWMFQPRHLAFPGAEGYGRFARGGRGGKVVYVTNLNSEGPGSLRWALTNGQGPRTVLFKVSGIIDLGFQPIKTDPFLTIAAQTAPGKGICIKHSDIGVGSDCIVRHLRARRGLGTPAETGNAIAPSIGTTPSSTTSRPRGAPTRPFHRAARATSPSSAASSARRSALPATATTPRAPTTAMPPPSAATSARSTTTCWPTATAATGRWAAVPMPTATRRDASTCSTTSATTGTAAPPTAAPWRCSSSTTTTRWGPTRASPSSSRPTTRQAAPATSLPTSAATSARTATAA